jgi:hypothetical protein
VIGAGWNIHKRIEITDAEKGYTSSSPFIYKVKKEEIVFCEWGGCFAIDKHLPTGDYA